MMRGAVGASIVSIITESLYDKPIVVFREYIQNAVDALYAKDKVNSVKCGENYSAQIWTDKDDLFFLDNGTGILPDRFKGTMTSIAHSQKRKAENIGYKGIGRLSGIPYCRKLSFINIVDYDKCFFQEYVIDGSKYDEIRKMENYNELSFDDLMSQIGTFIEQPNRERILYLIKSQNEMFDNESRNTGFLVILQDISLVLKNAIEDSQFLNNLGWLLPVPFLPELVTPSEQNVSNYELFDELSKTIPYDAESTIPAKAFNVYYNGDCIYRPLRNEMLRTYLIRSNLGQYAVCVHTFSNRKIQLESKNPFSGIKIYIDNVLLCDENELIPALRQYGFIQQGSTYEVFQAVRGIGAMIYIVDKVNISANARRTFINVTDEDSFNFLKLIGEFVDSIFTARYALSAYNSAIHKEEKSKEKIEILRKRAIESLENLARSDITLEVEDLDSIDFKSLTKTEQKRSIKSKINKEINSKIKKYLTQVEEFNYETCFDDFMIWLRAN